MDDRDRDETDSQWDLDWTESSNTRFPDSIKETQEQAPARREFTLEETFGSVTPLRRPEDFEELSRLAKEEKVARTLAELDEQSRG